MTKPSSHRFQAILTAIFLGCAAGGAHAEPLPKELVNVYAVDWWNKTSHEKIVLDVNSIKMITLRSFEVAYLARAYFPERGRNSMEGAVLIRPQTKEVVDVSDRMRTFEVMDLDHDGVTEIVGDQQGSGQGTTKGGRSVIQFDGSKAVVLREAQYEDNEGVRGKDDEGYQSTDVSWEFIEHGGATDLLEITTSVTGEKSSSTIRTFKFRKSQFVPFGQNVTITWPVPPKRSAAARLRQKHLASQAVGFQDYDTYSLNHQDFDALAKAYREAAAKPAVPYEVSELAMKAKLASEDKNFNYSSAVDMYTDALRQAPWWAEGYFQRAQTYASLGQYAAAIQDMERFLALEPQAANADAARKNIESWKAAAQPKAP